MKFSILRNFKKNIDQKEALKYAIIINVIFLIITFILCVPAYEANDDIAMSDFARGAYSEHSSYLVFINIILGYIFKTCYMFCNNINWYYVLQCLFMFLAFITLSYLVYMAQKKAEYPIAQGTMINVFLLIMFIPNTYLNFNFTKSAVVISLAGFFLLLYHIYNKHLKIHIILLGSGFIILGGMIRLESMLMVSIIPFLIVIFNIFKVTYNHISFNFRLCLKYAAIFFPIFVISLALSYFNTSRNPQYMEYNRARSSLLDYGLPEFNQNKKAYEKIGIDRNDYAMLLTWSFDDPEFFNVQKFKEIVALRKDNINIIDVFEASFNGIIKAIFRIGAAAIFVFLVALWLIFLKKNRIIPIMFTFALFITYFYLCFMGRLVDRVEQGLWMTGVYGLIVMIDLSMLKLPAKGKKKILILTCIVALLCNNNSILYNGILSTINMRTPKPINIADRLSEDKDNLYLIDTTTMSAIKISSSALTTEKEKYYSNLYTLGGWDTNLPIKKEILNTYGLNNPFKDAVSKNNVYFVDRDNFDIKFNYIREHYYPNLGYVLVKDLGLSKIYKLYGSEIKVPENLESINKKDIHFVHFPQIRDINGLHIFGDLKIDGFDTFDQEIFIKATNLDNGDVNTFQATTYVDDNNSQKEMNIMSKNVLSKFKVDIPNYKIKNNRMKFQIILKYHNRYYDIKTIKYDA